MEPKFDDWDYTAIGLIYGLGITALFSGFGAAISPSDYETLLCVAGSVWSLVLICEQAERRERLGALLGWLASSLILGFLAFTKSGLVWNACAAFSLVGLAAGILFSAYFRRGT